MSIKMAEYLHSKGYGFTEGNWFDHKAAASLILDAGDYAPMEGLGDQNNAYAVAVNSLKEAMDEMLNSTRKEVLTKEYHKNTDPAYSDSNPIKYRCGAVSCLRYKDKLYWCVTVVITDGAAMRKKGKEIETFNVSVDPAKIKFELNGWNKSGTLTRQITCGEIATPEINIPNFVPERAKGVEYTCPSEILTYTSNTPELFTVTQDGTVKALKAGKASLTVALKENPQVVNKTFTFDIIPNPNEQTGGKVEPETEEKEDTSGNASGDTMGNATGSTTDTAAGTVTPASGETAPAVTSSATLPKTRITKLKGIGSRKAKLKWKKCSKINGYQIQYSTSKKFKSNVKVKTVGKKKTSVILSGLKKNKTYYVRIRAYKASNGSKAYGKWSNARKIKIKK